MFIAALFTIAKTWKQPKCPSTDEWIKKMWHIYTMEYYSITKKNKIMPFAVTWLQLEILILSTSERERKMPCYITYMWNLKYGINKPIYKTETDSQVWRADLWLARRGGRREWDGLGVGSSGCKLLQLEWISNEVLLYNTGTISSLRELYLGR